MKTVKVGDRTYTIKELPPMAISYISLFKELWPKTPKNVEEAEEISNEIEKIVDYLFTACVEPRPTEDDAFKVIVALINAFRKTAEELTKTMKFRGGRPVGAERGVAVPTPKKTKRTVKHRK